MRFRPSWLYLLAALAVVGGPFAAAASEVKAVIELFTSQGCSSCPKADRLLGEFADDRRFVALSLAVDYWDYLGWRDTLALTAHSVRQKGYATQRGDRHVYTPQAVVNGALEAIGSDRYAIEHSVSNAGLKSKLTVPVTLTRSETNVDIEVGEGMGPAATIWMVAVMKKVPVTIERGENRGKTIIYHNVVRRWQRIGEWNGEMVRATVPLADIAQLGADAAAVLVQAGSIEKPGPICGAAMIGLY